MSFFGPSSEAPAQVVELEQVLSKRPDGRAKWLAKALIQARLCWRSGDVGVWGRWSTGGKLKIELLLKFESNQKNL